MKVTGFFCQSVTAAFIGVMLGIYGCSSAQEEGADLEVAEQQEAAEFSEEADPLLADSDYAGAAEDPFLDSTASLDDQTSLESEFADTEADPYASDDSINDSLENSDSAEYDSLTALADEASAEPVADEPTFEEVAEETSTEDSYVETASDSSSNFESGIEAAEDSFVYRVKRGDTISKICGNVYGDISMWEQVAQENSVRNPNLIYPGNTLTLRVTNDQSQNFRDSYLSETASYTIQNGDTLADIAERELGDRNQWRKLYEMNRQSIEDPHKIYSGQVLQMHMAH